MAKKAVIHHNLSPLELEETLERILPDFLTLPNSLGTAPAFQLMCSLPDSLGPHILP
jgi:hypothetical protein